MSSTVLSRSVSLVFAISVIGGSAAPLEGHVEAWGYNVFGGRTPPAGLDDIVAVAAGRDSLALRTNGIVVAWGGNEVGQTNVPPGLSNVVAIATAMHCVALKSDGTVVVWGYPHPAVTNVPAGLNGVRAIAAGNFSGEAYTLALRSNGTVVAWGLNPFTTNLPPGLSGVTGIAAGVRHAVALKSDSTVVAWGEDIIGEATPPPGLSGVVAVRAGGFASLALKSDGTLVQWGAFWDPPPGLDAIAEVQMGDQHVIALRSNGVAVAWGDSPFGQGAVPADMNGILAMSAGENYNLVITRRPLITSISSPVVAQAGDTVTFSVRASGEPLSYQWRRNGADLFGATNASLTLANVQGNNAGVYTVLVRNPYGSALSPSTSLSFPPPAITVEPQSVTRYRGENASFSVSATGIEPLDYQWFKASASLPGATAPTLTLTNLRTPNAGTYRAIVTDGAGIRATSAVATLTIIDPTLTNFVMLVPVSDTSIHSSGENPQGVTTILVGTRNNGITDRGLLRFNLSSIPAEAVFRSATLRLHVVRDPRQPNASNFSLYRMFRPWGIDATWTEATAGVPWSAPGGLSGVDYSASSTTTRLVGHSSTYDFGPSGQMAADAQSWLANPGDNHGWMLKTESEGLARSARHFASSEALNPLNAPLFLLEYGAPSPAARLTDLVAQAGNFAFRFHAAEGWFYRVECRGDLASGAWTTVTNVPAGPANAIVISVPIISPHRFYRVIAE